MTTPGAQPLYFGSEQRSLFGWLHAPSESRAAPDSGIVLCNPFGYEALCVHRTFRRFAEQAAEAGLAALRFDYDGTGDSAGDDYEAGRLEAWIASVNQAVEALKARTKVRRVFLAGMRLGATLAAIAAVERNDIAGLIAIAPVVKGRGFVRELRALALARPQPTPPEWARVNTDLQESAGFGLTTQTQKSLQEIDLATMSRAPAQVLLLERDDMPRNDAWGAHLHSLGVHVQRKTFAGYAAMISSPHEHVVPEAMLQDAIAWLNEQVANDRHSPAAVDTAPMRQSSFPADNVRESIARPDAESRLFAILTEPSVHNGAALAPRSVVLMLNAGAISRIGPGRLYVALARTLAQQGHAVLRLDISGIGDSRPHRGEPDNSVYTDRAQSDIDDAMKYLRRRFGDTPVHAVGICSGAYHLFKAAVAGLPFQTAIVINPLTFFWKEGMSLAEPEFQTASEMTRYRSRALKLSAWLKLLRGGVSVRDFVRVFRSRVLVAARHRARDVARRLGISVDDDLARELHQAVQRTQCLLFIFSEHDPGITLLREQGGSAVDCLQRRNRIQLEVIAAADHTFTAHWARDRLIDLLLAHLNAGSIESAAA